MEVFEFWSVQEKIVFEFTEQKQIINKRYCRDGIPDSYRSWWTKQQTRPRTVRGLLLLGHEGHGAVLVFFSPKVSYVHGRKPEVLQRSFVLFFPSNKISLQISCCPFRKKTLETPLELCTGGQLKFLESRFRICLGAVHSQNSHSTLSTQLNSTLFHSILPLVIHSIWKSSTPQISEA